MKRLASFIAALATPALAHAAPDGSGLGAALQALAGLGIVLGLIVATAFVMKRLQPGRFGGSALLKPIAQIAVGARERVVVVEMGETWLVLGVTANGITNLHTTAKGEVPAANSSSPASARPFSEWLARARAPHAER